MSEPEAKHLRIGEVSRRTGVAVATLRAWERRYEVLAPERTSGGHRLYGDDDVTRVRDMQRLIDDGWAAGSAAREVLRRPAEVRALRAVSGGDPAEHLRHRLTAAFDAFDAAAADGVLDDTFARLDLPAALDEVVLPVVRGLGDGWESSPRVIAREHFASNTVRPRLIRLLRLSRPGRDRVLVAAAPATEEHDLGLLAASAAATADGWAVHFLGARTPTVVFERALEDLGATVGLIGSVRRETAAQFLLEVSDPATPVVLGGHGFVADDLAGHPRWRRHDGDLRGLADVLDEARRSARSA